MILSRQKAVLLTLILTGAAVGGLGAFMSCVAESSAAAPRWPAQVQLAPSSQVPTMVVFLHPHARNSMATLKELTQMLPELKGRTLIYLSFFAPDDRDTNWVRQSPFYQASKMPGVNIYLDHNGQDSEKFGAHSSGEIFLYSQGGKLLFHGGLTSLGFGRPSETKAILLRQLSAVAQSEVPYETPVWGRGLRNRASVALLDLP